MNFKLISLSNEDLKMAKLKQIMAELLTHQNWRRHSISILSGEYLSNLHLGHYMSKTSGTLHIGGARQNKVDNVQDFVIKATFSVTD